MEIDSQGAEFVYLRREPEREVLHRALVEHLETFLEQAQTADFGLPRHVVRELRDYVKCGILANGLTANDEWTNSLTRLYLCSSVD